MPNQHKPLPPLEDIRGPFKAYFDMDLPDTEIAEHLKSHYDTKQYGCSVISVRRLRKQLGLKRTRQQKHTTESIKEQVLEIKKKFPHRGILAVRKNLRQEFKIRASENTVKELLRQIEPDAMRQRKGKKFRRTKFYAAGVNDCWTQDQHDKWGPRFGLWLHNNIDPFTGFNNWLQVWWTNKNPRLIVKYFLDACRKLEAIPVYTQSDPGNENNGVANAQTIMRQTLDPELAGTLQHKWKTKKNNPKSEANWSVMRADLSPGLEDLFEKGVQNGWYDVGIPIENLVFRWIAIPFVQVQLDLWVVHRNQTKPRKDRNKVTPHGIPELLRAKPDFFGIVDFKIPVNPELLDEVEAEFAPANHEVFQLTPPEFDRWANTYYTQMGKPLVTYDTFWDVYRELLAYFMRVPNVEQDLHIPLSLHAETERRINEEELPLMLGQQPLRMVEMPPSNGELNSPDAAGPSTIGQTSRNVYGCPEYVHFTSSEDEYDEGDESVNSD
ncbi:hypothetical protein B0H15DRAFT_787815 [Mycena belliarum]|uniref:Uncharacterized protein n=1 Tax=Mycena belliarum TaxID=1033014 RepID=A0AAD6TZN4_9AGAR|nr:hypothetical protein B0H15DRAFT_787815 [Mycena belliae]